MTRYIHYVKVERPAASETVTEARARLGEKFPRSALRRMTHLGLLVGATLEGWSAGQEDVVVYATTFAETRALEDYLGSFPTPSPLLFQTSIHPSAVQQVLIARQRPLPRLWPITGRARLVEQALLAALLEPAERCLVVGGEERGTWMLEHSMASDRPFAFAALLTHERTGATGSVRFTPVANAPEVVCPTMIQFADALAERSSLRWHGTGGEWSVEWL